MVPSASSVCSAHISWLELRRQSRSVEFYRYTHGKLTAYLSQTEGAPRLDKMSPAKADAYAKWLLEQGVSKITMQHCVSALCCLTRWATREGYLRSNPLEHYVVPKAKSQMITGYKPEEVQALVDACRKTALGQRNAAILILTYDVGIRSSELAALTVGDIDTNKGTVMVRNGKGNKFRMVAFSSTTAKVLRKYLIGHPDGGNGEAPLFPSKTGGHLTRGGVYQMTRRIAREAGIAGRVGLHKMRHAMALQTLVNGGNIRMLQSILGHSDLATLERYTQFSDDALRQQRETSSPVAKLKGIR